MKSTYFKLLTLLFSIAPLVSNAQSSKPNKNQSVLLLLKKYINERNTHLVYSLGSEKYKAGITSIQLNDFLEKQIYILGKINKSLVVKAKNSPDKYKLELDGGNVLLSFSLNNKNKLNELTFDSFVPIVTLKKTLVPSSNPLKSTLDKQIDSVARAYIQNSNTVGLSIGVFKDGQNYTYGYGTSQKKNGVIPDANTLFEIGSLTKTFTSLILADFVNNGKISLSDPIVKYLPDSVAANPELQKIKIVNLSNHTSGLARLPENMVSKNMNPVNPYKNYTNELLFAYLKDYKLITMPGEVYNYSNTGVGLLGVILERISGKTYEQLVQEYIAGPLKMNSTVQHVNSDLTKRFVKVYNNEAKTSSYWDYDALVGCGGLRSTANDLLIYARNEIQSENADLSKAFKLSQEVTFKKEPMVSLGWHVFQLENSNYYWHNGGTGGSSSYLIFNKEKKLAVIVLSNAAVPVDGVGSGILDKLL